MQVFVTNDFWCLSELIATVRGSLLVHFVTVAMQFKTMGLTKVQAQPIKCLYIDVLGLGFQLMVEEAFHHI